MRLAEVFYPEIAFGGYTDIDSTVAFYTRVRTLTGPSTVLLDVGCGRGAYLDGQPSVFSDVRKFKGTVGRVIGIDVREEFATNPGLDEYHLIVDDRWPLETESVDVIVCDCVLEHLEAESHFFREVARVLKYGGYFCARTPNVMSYFGAISALSRGRLRQRLLKLAKPERKEEDTFPTRYAFNTHGALKRTLRKHGLNGVVYGYEDEPSYLDFSAVAYTVGVLHQRFAPRRIKPLLFCFARKGS